MVDVAHDRDDGRPRREIGRVVLERLRLFVLVGGVLDGQLALGGKLGPDQLDLVVGQGLGDGDNLAQAHHEHDDLGRRDAERLRQVAHRHTRLDCDGPGRGDDLTRGLRPRSLAVALLLPRVARARCGVVDDDAPLSPLAGTTLTWPHRAIWSI